MQFIANEETMEECTGYIQAAAIAATHTIGGITLIFIGGDSSRCFKTKVPAHKIAALLAGGSDNIKELS